MKPETLTLVDDSGNPVETLPATDKKGNKVGDYTVDKQTGEVIFTPTDKKFSGKVLPARVRMQDSNGTPAETTYTPNIVPVRPVGEPAESTAPQGVAQEGTVTFTGGKVTVNDKEETVKIKEGSARLLDKNGQPLAADAVQDVMGPDGNKIGEYRLEPATNKVTYTPTNVNYVGEVPAAEIGALDENGTLAVTTYTPNITPTYPTAEEATSVDVQGAVQKGTVEFKAGSEVVLIDKTKTTLLDENGQPAEKVSAKSPEGEVIGEYTLNKETGEVTFTPDPKKPYAGDVVPVKVQAQNTAGTTVETTYTPSIIPVNPSANPATSEGPQGVEQTGTVEFIPGNPQKAPESPAPIDKSTIKLLDKSGNEVETVTVTDKDGKEIGVYSLVKDSNGVPTGEVKFTPTDKTYVGKVEPVTVQAKDKNSTVAKTTYTPNFTGVEPTGTPAESTGIQGKTQEGAPTFTPGNDKVPMKIDETQPATFYNPVTKEPIAETEVPATKDGKEVGKYTIDPKSGTVTFTPNKDFTGTPDPVTVQAKDANGTPTTATYTPTVTPVTPTAEGAKSEGAKGQPQKGTPKFTPGNTEVPITITEEQPATFYNPVTKEPIAEKEIPATKDGKEVGKYKIDPKSGKVTFTPNKDFVGTPDPATVQVKDANGTPTTATYTPTVRPVTEFVDKDGNLITVDGNNNPVESSVDGKTDKKVIPGYKFVETKVDEKGNTKHIYEKVTTSFKDKEGKEIPNYPTEEGTTPKKDNIPGYRFVETKKLPNGDVEHVYEKVTTPTPAPAPTPTTPVYEKVLTTYVDENGELIIPNENGSHPGKELKDYEIVRTEKDANGNVRNVYRKVTPSTPESKVITTFVDENGNVIVPNENGEVPAKDIAEYELVRTEKDENGNVRHIYRKVAAPAPKAVETTPAKQEKVTRQELPNTGTGQESAFLGAAASAILAGLGLVAPKRNKKDEE